MTVDEVKALRQQGYQPRDYYKQDSELKEAIDMVKMGYFSKGDDDLFNPLVNELLAQDSYLLLADYAAYLAAQARVSQTYLERDRWCRMSILSSARSGQFSSIER